MTAIDKARRGAGSDPLAWVYSKRLRSAIYQIFTFGTVVWLGWYLFTNTSTNMEARGMSSGFDFLWLTAGFDTDFKLIPYIPGDTYFRIYLVGITNTLFVSLIAIVFTTAMGFVVGIMRLSSNWLVARLALTYIEILRNTPLLLQIVFWYMGVFSLLPRPKQSYEILNVAVLNNRGFYIPDPQPGDLFWLTTVAFFIGIVAVIFMRRWAHKRQDKSGEAFHTFWVGLAILIGLPGIVFLMTGMPLEFTYPVLQGFNYEGGLRTPPAFLAMLVALSVYHSSYMAEMVRAGILSVNKGQTEASLSLGLTHTKTLQLVVIPQAMRAIVPPMISLWMNVVKNSSLAVAIGYPEIVSVFMQTALNQSGYAIEIVAMTMLFYMSVSLTISGCLNIYNKRVQIKER